MFIQLLLIACWLIFMVNVGINIPYMDAMGLVFIYDSLTTRCFSSNVDGGLLRRSLA